MAGPQVKRGVGKQAARCCLDEGDVQETTRVRWSRLISPKVVWDHSSSGSIDLTSAGVRSWVWREAEAGDVCPWPSGPGTSRRDGFQAAAAASSLAGFSWMVCRRMAGSLPRTCVCQLLLGSRAMRTDTLPQTLSKEAFGSLSHGCTKACQEVGTTVQQ